MKKRLFYEEKFAEYPDVVTIPEFCKMLGGISISTARKLLVDNSLAHSQYLEGICNTVLVKDMMTRKKLNDITLVKFIASFLSSNVGSPVSAKKIADTLTSSGRPTSVATVETYLEALCDSYLFYKVQRYDIKGKLHLKTESKY